MKWFLFLFLFLMATNNFVLAQEQLIKVFNPKEVSVEVAKYQGIPKDLEGLNWNRWTSKNFTVCSLNDPQAQYLYKHLELVKGWIFSRWGLYDIDFSAPCKLICVDNPSLFKKLFNLEKTKVEIRRDSNNRITETVVFLLIDGPPSDTIPVPLTEVCLAEFCQKFNCEFNFWAKRGMSLLNASLDQIKINLNKDIDSNLKNVFETTPEQYQKLSAEQKKVFDKSVILLCLLLRKEFGQDKFLLFLQSTSENNPDISIKDILKFENIEEFGKTFARYVEDLMSDMAKGKTPNSYLQIYEKKN